MGIFLIIVGLVALLISLGYLDWSILGSLYTLWPLLLVAAGISLIFKKKLAVKVVVWVLVIAALISYSYFGSAEIPFFGRGSVSNSSQQDRIVKIGMNEGVKRGVFKLDVGASKLFVEGGSEEMMDASIQDPEIKCTSSIEGDLVRVNINKPGFDINTFNDGDIVSDYSNTFRLSKNIVWELDLDTGGVDMSIDLTGLNAEKISIATGAANIKVIAGKNSKYTNMKIDAGFSKIDIDVPEAVGVKDAMDGGFSASNFKEAEWTQKGGYYYSQGYDAAEMKLDIDIDTGFGDVKVNFIND